MPPGKRSSGAKNLLTPDHRYSFNSFFSTDDRLWTAKTIVTFFRNLEFGFDNKVLTSYAIKLTKEQVTQLPRKDPVSKSRATKLRNLLTELYKLKRQYKYKTPPRRGIHGPSYSPHGGPIFNVCTGGLQTNKISLVADGSNSLSCGSPSPPSPGSEYSCSSDTSLQPDTFSIHFRNMHDKLLLGDMYLEDLIYNFLEGKSKVGDREWWLLESCIVNLDYLSWLDDPTRTKLKSLIPKSPPTPEAISLCEAYLQPFWESANFEDDMPPILARTPWNKPEHYIVYNYYHLLVHYWYNFIPTIGLDPSRGSESWLSARVYNYLFDLFRAPLVSLRFGETASLHSPDYRFDGIFCWNNIEFGALEIAPEGTYSSHQAKVDKDCYKLYQVVGKIYNKLNAVANSKVPHPAVGIMCRGFSFTIIKVSQLNKNLLQTSHHEFMLPTSISSISDLKGILHSMGILYNMLNGNRKFVQEKLCVNNIL